jgi:MFS family permease
MPLRNKNYRLLWFANLIASFSGHVAMIAFPLVAIQYLGATDWEMGLLIGVEVLPFLLLSLPSGTWVDRFEGKRMLQACMACLALAGLIVPVCYLMGWLTMGVLYVGGFLIGCTMCVEGTVSQVFTTELVGRKDLVQANAWMMGAESGLKLIGPAAGGLLVQTIGAPMTLWLEALLPAVACGMLIPIHVTHQRERSVAQAMVPMIREGLAAVWASPVLRSAAAMMVCWQFLWHGVYALLVLHATRDLGLSPAQLGIATAMGSIGILCGTLVAKRVEQHWGLGTGTLMGFVVTSLGWSLMAASIWIPKDGAMIAFGMSYAVMDFGLTLGFICYTSLRQAVTSDVLLGRVVATMRWLSLLLAPLGSVALGALSHAGATRYHISGTALAIGLAAAISLVLCAFASRSALAKVKTAQVPNAAAVGQDALRESHIAEQRL